MVPTTFPSKKSAQRCQSKESEIFTILKRDLVDSFASLSKVYTLLLFLEQSPWEQGMLSAVDARPRGQDNWKCSRTSCSWETFCLLVCSLETWLLAFLPRPLELGRATARVFCLDPCAIPAVQEVWFCVLWPWRLEGLPSHVLAHGHPMKLQTYQQDVHLSWK